MTDYIDSMSEQVSMCHSEDNWSKDFIGIFFMVYLVYSSILSCVSVPVQDGFINQKPREDQ